MILAYDEQSALSVGVNVTVSIIITDNNKLLYYYDYVIHKWQIFLLCIMPITQKLYNYYDFSFSLTGMIACLSFINLYSIFFQIDGYCINALNNITLFVQCDYIPGVLQKTHDIMASSTIKILHHYISLIIPESHHDRSCASEIALENDVNLRGITFSKNK